MFRICFIIIMAMVTLASPPALIVTGPVTYLICRHTNRKANRIRAIHNAVAAEKQWVAFQKACR